MTDDPIVAEMIADIDERIALLEEMKKDLKQRSEVGIKKYGTTLARDDLKLSEWLQHAYEEDLDRPLYIKRAIKKARSEGR
jgi:hypothetical protein